jgi:RimJ/RimL family protein N-acetyltransferase
MGPNIPASVPAGVPASAPTVVRVTPGVHWHALDDDEVAGRAYGLHRPDRRVFVSVDSWREDAFHALVDAVIGDLRRDLYTMVDEADAAELARWSAVGFEPHRREDNYVIPTAPELTGLDRAAVPPGFATITADAADEDRLRALDELLRADVPGCDGWVNDPDQFHGNTFDPRHFDPATYLVAVHHVGDGSDRYAGLVRVWNIPRHPRLGLVGVARPYRRRGLARALLAAVFAQLHARGATEVLAEADVANAASTALLAGIGARRTGGAVELIRRRRR